MTKTEVMHKVGEFQNICKDNPIFPECDFIRMLEKEIPNMEMIISEGEIMYRARIYSDDWVDKIMEIAEEIHNSLDLEMLKKGTEKQERLKRLWDEKNNSGFFGYDEDGSFVNKNRKSIHAGRCNHEFESCLYAGEDINTAISELKPLINEKISVAEIQAIRSLRLVDLSIDIESRQDILKNIVGTFFLISPTEENKDAYICTQIICALVKHLGYDGIRYTSCQNHNKNNYAIFNYSKCKAIGSEIFSVEKIEYTTKKHVI